MGEQPMPVVTRHQKAQNTASWARANSKLINLEPKDTTPCEKCCEKPHEGAMILGFRRKRCTLPLNEPRVPNASKSCALNVPGFALNKSTKYKAHSRLGIFTSKTYTLMT